MVVCTTRDKSGDLIDLLFESEDGFGILPVYLYAKAKDLYAVTMGMRCVSQQGKS